MTNSCCPSHSQGWHYLIQGADAADEVLTTVFGIRSAVRKDNSDPTSKQGFEKILRGMIGELFRVAQPHEQAALQSALHALDVNWAGMTPTEITEALDEAGKHFGGVPKLLVQPVIETLTKQGVAMVTATKAAAAGRYDLPIAASFNTVDQKVIDHAASSHAFYVRDEFGKRQAAFSTIARQVVARGLEDGLDKHEIGKDLAAAASAAMVNRSESYWTNIASIFATRARTWGTMSSFQEGGIERYEISATLDEVSCDVCRFMDGKTFSVESAVNSFKQVADSQDPEAVAQLQPFMHIGVSASGDKGLFYGSGDSRVAVARVTDSAVGQKDALGSFSHAMGGKELEKNGLSSPPFHGSCRCLCVASFEPAVEHSAPQQQPTAVPVAAPPKMTQTSFFMPSATPLPQDVADQTRPLPTSRGVSQEYVRPTPAPVVPPLSAAEQKKVDDLAKLDALPEHVSQYGIKGYVDHGLPTFADPMVSAFPASQVTPTKLAGAKKQKGSDVAIADITHGFGGAHKGAVAMIMGNDTPSTPTLVKHQDKLYSLNASSTAHIVAAHLQGESTVKAQIVDLDKVAKPKKVKPAPVAPVAPTASTYSPVAAPRAVAAHAAAAQGDASNILHTKTGAAAGSNDGGFYTGTDGIKRYVKFYDDASQARSEHLANAIYADLGHTAPTSQLFEHNGKLAYSSELFEGGETLKSLGGASSLTKKDAEALMKGFVGDVLTGNWDAVGTGYDNVMRTADGKWARIDNGGTFLFRAKAGKKGESALNAISEWDVFFTGTNPFYSAVAKAAGAESAEDLKHLIVPQIQRVVALADAPGGWAAYVDKHIPGAHGADCDRIVEMLEARSLLLKGKLAELTAPPAVAPAPGVARYVARQYSTVMPSTGLKLEDLPETHVIDDHYEKWSRVSPTHMPSGEKFSDYQKRAKVAVKGISSDSLSGIKAFTGSSYGAIRASEERGTPDNRSKAIQKAFDIATPEPGTVFRAIHSIDRDVIEKYMGSETFQLGKTGGATSSSAWNIDASIDGFMGGRHDPSYGDTYKILYVINGKTQIPVQTISSVGESECELMFKKDAKFRVTGLSRAAGTKRVLILEAEEIL